MATTSTPPPPIALRRFLSPNSIRPTSFFFSSNPNFPSIISRCSSSISRSVSGDFASSKRLNPLQSSRLSTVSTQTTHYEFYDGSSEVELRLELGVDEAPSSKDIQVETDENSLTIRVQRSGALKTLIETDHLYEKIKPAETIWYIDDDQLVVNLKKQDQDLNWPDIVETWESLTVGITQLLKGASVYLVGDSTEINMKIARELAVGLGYTPLSTEELLEAYAKQDLDSWLIAEGSESVAEAEATILETLSSHVRAVVATLGGQHGAAGRANKWRHLHSGFTIWLSQSQTTDEESATEEARREFVEGKQAYSNADVVIKLGGWDDNYSKTVAQASLSALKRLILTDKKLPGKKSLYIRLGCRGDWPNIKPPGWDPSAEADPSS